jgi:hypothetical protein
VLPFATCFLVREAVTSRNHKLILAAIGFKWF